MTAAMKRHAVFLCIARPLQVPMLDDRIVNWRRALMP
jgi:hypothetical protein